MKPESGYLILKTFLKMCRNYAPQYCLTRDLYAIPRIDRQPQELSIQYRGIDRDAISLEPGREGITGRTAGSAEARMAELEKLGRSQQDFLFRLEDAVEIYELLGESKTDYEIIWVRIASANRSLPPDFHSIGFEPSWFCGDHFSASSDCMMFPRWHGTDEEGELFKDYFLQLNAYGMFDTRSQSRKFLKYYLSFDWTETGDYKMVEVFIRP